MVDPNDSRAGPPPNHIHIETKRPNWLAWVALLLGVLALLFALSRCHREAPVVAQQNNSTNVIAETPNAKTSAVLAGTSGLGDYLAGSDPAPRSFVFEKLNFDTAKSEIRAADTGEVVSVAAVLKQYPKARIQIAGYADARGSGAANATLGQERADSVKSALVAKGIKADRIKTATGGESDPVGSNATSGGQFENRRTELVVTER